MENELQVQPNQQRTHSAQAILVATSKITIPDEVRASLSSILDASTDDDFFDALSKWNAFTIYGINLKVKEVTALFLRLDSLILSRVSKLKQPCVENTSQVENEIEKALEATWFVVDNLHYTKYLILFKSLDLFVDILLHTTRFSNWIKTVDLLSIVLPIYKNKNLMTVELKNEKLDELILMLETFVHNLNMLSSRRVVDVEDYLATKGAEKTITPKLKILLKDPEFLVDTSRDDWVSQLHPDDPEMVDQLTERQLAFSEIMRYSEEQMANDLHIFVTHSLGRKKKPLLKTSPLWIALRVKIMFLRELNTTQCTTGPATLILESLRILQHILEDRAAKYVPLPGLPDWACVEKHISEPLHPKILMHLLDAKWARLKTQAYKKQDHAEMHNLVQKSLASLVRRIEQDRTPVDQLATEDRDEKLLIVTESLIITCVELGSHLYESDTNNKHSDEDELPTTSIDFSLSMDLSSAILCYLQDERSSHLHFSPKLISHLLEFLKQDVGACPRVLPRILDTLAALVKKPAAQFNLDGKIVPLARKRYREFLNEFVELADSIFVDPLKAKYTSSLPGFAKEAAEHALWSQLAHLPEDLSQVLNPIVVFLDDILTEMPENLVNPTLKHMQEIGLAQRLINNFFQSDSLDYEFIGFFIQFLGKHINSPSRFPDLDETLSATLKHAFSQLFDRKMVLQNLRRFANADSSNSLVVLAEEIIDLVNIKHSLTEMLLTRFESFLTEATCFYTELWKALPHILRGDTRFISQNFPELVNRGWTFTEDIKDNLIILDKLNHNLLKFMAKFYDFRRTNIYESLPKIEALQRFIAMFQLQPIFDSNMSKIRKWATQSLLRMIEHHKLPDEPVAEDGSRKSQADLIKSVLTTTADSLEHLAHQWPQMSGKDQDYFCGFLFRQTEASLSIELAAQADLPSSKLGDMLENINRYLHATVLVDIFKNASIISNRGAKVEPQLEQILARTWKASIAFESQLSRSKARWLAQRVESFELPPQPNGSNNETSIDQFHSHVFGSNEVYNYEVSSKGYEKILKHLLAGPNESKMGVISTFAKDIAEAIESCELPEEPTIASSLIYVQNICFLKSFLTTFDGIGMQTLLKKHKVFVFCIRAILFGFRFITEHKQVIHAIKSIPDSRKADPTRPLAVPKSENLVRVTVEQTRMRLAVDTLCEQLEVCWRIIRCSFELQDPGEITSKEEEFKQEVELYGLRYSLLDGLSVLISAVNDDIASILDLNDLQDNLKPIATTKGKPIAPVVEEPEEPKLVAKNVPKGYRLLDGLYRFLKTSDKTCLALLPKYLKLINHTQDHKPVELPQAQPSSEGSNVPQQSVAEISEGNNKMLEEGAQESKAEITKIINELEQVKPEELNYLNHQLCLTKEQFIDLSKKKLEKILDGVYPGRTCIFGNDPTFTVQAYLAFSSKQPDFKRQSQSLLNKIHSSLGEIRSSMFFKSDGSATPAKDKFRISNGFIKQFRAGKYTIFRQLQTHLSMLMGLHAMNDIKKLGLTFQRELNLLITWLTEIFQSFHKLVEIKSLTMEAENFRRRYDRVLQMINKMLAVILVLNAQNKEGDHQAEPVHKNEAVQPRQSSAVKHPHKKGGAQTPKDAKQIETLKSDLVTSMSEYLGNYPTFMRQKINLLNSATVSGMCNLLFFLGKEKPEIKEAIRHLEIVKKVCRAGYFTDRHETHTTLELSTVRAFLALVEDQARSERLLQESLRLEIKEYLQTYENVQLEKATKKGLQAAKLSIEEKYTPLTQFESTFNRVGQAHGDLLLKITKDRCVIHQKGNDRYITLATDKKEKEFVMDGDSISTMIILLKEIVRCSANIIFDRTTASGEKFVPCRQTVSLPLMMETLQALCKRFPLLLKMVATHNISKFVRKVKSSWVKERFFNEIKHNKNITFLQFYVRVILFVDFKCFRNFFLISSQDSYVHIVEEDKSSKTQTKMTLGCFIRKTYFRELSCELDKLGQQLQSLLSQPKYGMKNTNDIGMPNKYFIMRLAATYCALSQDVASLLPYVRQAKSVSGEFRIGAIQQKLTKIVEGFGTETEKNFESLHEILSKALCFVMKMNFLCAANQQKLEEYDARYNFKNVGQQEDCVHVLLNDFESFRAKSLDEQAKPYRKTSLVWHDAALDLGRFKDIRDYSSSGQPLMMSGAPWAEEDEDLGEEEQDFDEDDDDGFDDDDQDEFGDDASGSDAEGSESRLDQEQMIDEAEVEELLQNHQENLLGIHGRRNPFMPSNHSLTSEYMSADPYEYSDEIEDEDIGEEELEEGEEEMGDEYYGSSGEEEGEEDTEVDMEIFEASDQENPNDEEAADLDEWRLGDNNLNLALQNLRRSAPGLDRFEFVNLGGPPGRPRNPFLDPPPQFFNEFHAPSESSSGAGHLMIHDEDSSERSDDQLLRIRISAAAHDDMMSDIFNFTNRISPFSTYDPMSGSSVKPNQPLKDAFHHLGAFYPFYDCIRVSGLLEVILVDQQLNEYQKSFDSILENWEGQHALQKWAFHENSIALYKLREHNREDMLVLKNYTQPHDKRRQTTNNRQNRRFQAYQIGGFQIGQRRRSTDNSEDAPQVQPARNNPMDELMSMVNRYTEANRMMIRDDDLLQRPPIRGLNMNPDRQTSGENGSLVSAMLRELPVIQHQVSQSESKRQEGGKDQKKDPKDPLGLEKFLNPKVDFDWESCGLNENFLEAFGVDSLFFSALDLNRQAELIKSYLIPSQIPQFNLGVAKMLRNNPNQSAAVPNPIPPRPRAFIRTDPRSQPISFFSSSIGGGLNRSRSNSRFTDNFESLYPNWPNRLADRSGGLESAFRLHSDNLRALPTASTPVVHSESDAQSRSRLSDANEMAEEQGESQLNDEAEEQSAGEEESGLEQSASEQSRAVPFEIPRAAQIAPADPAPAVVAQPAVNANRFSQENVDSLNALPHDLREEVLMTYPMDYINTLSPELILEATRIRLMGGGGGNFGWGIPRNGPGMAIEEEDESSNSRGEEGMDEDGSDSAQSKSDRNVNSLDLTVFMKINTLKETFLERFLTSVITNNNQKSPFVNMLSVSMANFMNQAKIYDAFLFMLEHPDLNKLLRKGSRFPPKLPPCGTPTNQSSISHKAAYQKMSLRLLGFLSIIVRDFPTYFQKNQLQGEKVSPSTHTLTELYRLRQQHKINTERNGFWRLIDLFSKEELSCSREHLEGIVQVISQLLRVSKPKKKELDENMTLGDTQVNGICNTLVNDNMNNQSLSRLSGIISVLCGHPENLNKFISEMNKSLQSLLDSIRIENKKLMEVLSESVKRKTQTHRSFISLIAGKLGTRKKEQRVAKVFKTIEQLFEKYFEVTNKKHADLMSAQQDTKKHPDEQAILDFKKVSPSKMVQEEIQLEGMIPADSNPGQPIQTAQKTARASRKLATEDEEPEAEVPKTQSKTVVRKGSEELAQLESLVDEETMKEIRARFSHILEDQHLMNFWLDLIEILRYFNKLDVEVLNQLHPHLAPLLPLIESFFIGFKILCDDDHLSALKLKTQRSTKKVKRKKSMTISNLVDEIEDEAQADNQDYNVDFEEIRNRLTQIEMTELFTVMCDSNKTFLNYLIEKDLSLLNGSLNCIVKRLPRCITFDNKRVFFQKFVKKASKSDLALNVSVRRQEIFSDSFHVLMNKSPNELKRKLQIVFSGEEGNDAGGLTREWFLALSKQMLNPDYGLFKTSAAGETFQPNPFSSVTLDHIKFFKFIGIIVGKVVYCSPRPCKTATCSMHSSPDHSTSTCAVHQFTIPISRTSTHSTTRTCAGSSKTPSTGLI